MFSDSAVKRCVLLHLIAIDVCAYHTAYIVRVSFRKIDKGGKIMLRENWGGGKGIAHFALGSRFIGLQGSHLNDLLGLLLTLLE